MTKRSRLEVNINSAVEVTDVTRSGAGTVKLLTYQTRTSLKALWADSAIRGNMTIINPIFINPWLIWAEVLKSPIFLD